VVRSSTSENLVLATAGLDGADYAADDAVVETEGTPMSEQSDDARAARAPITVTRRQVKAAQIAVKGHQKLGRPVPPGLQRIANAKPARSPRD
jgi:hypothetical protein